MLQPYFTPDFTSNQLVTPVLSGTEHWLPSDIALTISASLSGIPDLSMIIHKISLAVNKTKGLLIVHETFHTKGETSFTFLLHNVSDDKGLFYYSPSLFKPL